MFCLHACLCVPSVHGGPEEGLDPLGLGTGNPTLILWKSSTALNHWQSPALVPLTELGLSSLLSSAFTSTGFDCHTSPVFSPANPESSIEDCLAHLGERVSQDLKEPLQKALQTILSQ